MGSAVKCLILLTTGRGRDLVIWELKNQADFANVPLLSVSSLSENCTGSTSDRTVTCAAKKKMNEVLFRAVFSCPAGSEQNLKSVLSNCILLRSAYDEEVCRAAGTDQLWNNLFEMGLSTSVSSEPLLCFLICTVAIAQHATLSTASFNGRQPYYFQSASLSLHVYTLYLTHVITKYADVNFIGRRIKAEKFISQAISKFNPKSKKRKLGDNEEEHKEKMGEMNDQKDETSYISIAGESSEIRSKVVDERVNQGTVKNLHLLCDLRGLTNFDEKSAIYYAAALYCSGGDSACQKFSKIYAKKDKNLSSSRAHSTVIARTSNSTTAMDFERCYLTVTSALVLPGHVIIDPFSGSGAILKMGTLFGSTVFSSDLDPLCCADSGTNPGLKGCSVVGNIKNSPWRGTYDAIVTDPPYSMRTSLLPDHASLVNQHQSTDPGSLALVPSLPNHISHSSEHTDIGTVLPSEENPNIASFSTSSTTLISASHSSLCILEDLISFASTHLVPDGRLVFWWPEVQSSNMTIEQEIENLISRDTRSRGGEILTLLSISRDDYGLGRSKENCLDIRRNESSMRSSHMDMDIDINIDNENQNNVQVTSIKCEKLKNKEKRKENTIQIDLEASNDKCNTEGIESKMIISPTSDVTENWVRCLIVIRKLDGKKDKILTPKNPESSGSRSIISQEEDIVTCYPPCSKGVTKSITCLPNIFNNISDKQNEETSLEFDNFIFPGFRKNLFDATWRGDISALDRLEAKVNRILDLDSANHSLPAQSTSPTTSHLANPCPSSSSHSTHPSSLPSVSRASTSPPSSSSSFTSCLPSSLSSSLPLLLPTPLHSLSAISNSKSIWDSEDSKGNRPLIFAAGYGHCNVLQWLLQRGCDINFSPKGGCALIRAARFGHACCVSLLLSEGTDTALMDSDGFTAAAHAVAFNHLSVLKILPISTLFTENLNPKSRILPIGQNRDNISEFIKEAYSTENDENCTDSGVTHLRSACHIACQWGSVDSLQHLLHYNTAQSDALGIMESNSHSGTVTVTETVTETETETVGPYEEQSGMSDVLDIQGIPEDSIRTKKEPLNSGNERRTAFNVNATLSDGTTPLHLAARYGHLSCLKLLIAAEADFRVVDLHGNSPLLLAQKWGREECEEYLSNL